MEAAVAALQAPVFLMYQAIMTADALQIMDAAADAVVAAEDAEAAAEDAEAAVVAINLFKHIFTFIRQL